jgi:N6-adenosine-specific RNA methylase IME4
MKTQIKTTVKSVHSGVVATGDIAASKSDRLRVHPAALHFPRMSEKDAAALREDIRLNGQLVPIWTLNDEIVDGRERYDACLELGIEPKLARLDGKMSAEQAVVSHNLNRKHFTESQRAMAACRLVTTRRGSNQSDNGKVTQDEVANLVGVSIDSIQRALTVLKAGDKRLVGLVENGKLTAFTGSKVAGLSADNREKAVAAANDDNFLSTVKSLISAERHAKTREKVAELQANNKSLDTVPGKFGIIYADPAWDYLPPEKTGYPTMCREELLAMDVRSKAADDAVCFMWVPAGQLPLALEVMAAWGFEYKTHAVWDKESPGTGMYFQSRHELLLLGTRGNVPAVPPKLRPASIITEKRREHSRKPRAAFLAIEQMYPGLTKLELFARGKARDGWFVWGNEAIPSDEQVKAEAVERKTAPRIPPTAKKPVMVRKPAAKVQAKVSKGRPAANEVKFRRVA